MTKRGKGRPPKYQEQFNHMAYVACAEGGMSDPQLAKLFKVDRSTINEWKLSKPGFKAEIIKGKDEYDTFKIESALKKNAKGFRFTETTREPVVKREIDDDGNIISEVEEMKVTKTVSKLVVPNVKAQTYWLNNRNSQRWKSTMKFDIDADLVLKRTKKRYDGESDDDDDTPDIGDRMKDY